MTPRSPTAPGSLPPLAVVSESPSPPGRPHARQAAIPVAAPSDRAARHSYRGPLAAAPSVTPAHAVPRLCPRPLASASSSLSSRPLLPSQPPWLPLPLPLPCSRLCLDFPFAALLVTPLHEAHNLFQLPPTKRPKGGGGTLLHLTVADTTSSYSPASGGTCQ
eukprot:448159-Rhodomonas_salina.2